MEEHKIAFMSDEGVYGGLPDVCLRGIRPSPRLSSQYGRGFFEGRVLLSRGEGFPGGPAKSHHLVQHARTFESQWNGGERGHCPLFWHRCDRQSACLIPRCRNKRAPAGRVEAIGALEDSRLEGKCNAKPSHDPERKSPVSPTGEGSAAHCARRRHAEAGCAG